eukprot:jgi/Mesen1/8699/ME000052S08126
MWGEGPAAGGAVVRHVASPERLIARTGRQQQRYESGCRLVAGCIPYRTVQPAGPESAYVEVMMISSQRGLGLVFPKGGWETDETAEEAACREALEEAGVRGILQGKLGSYDFQSKSARSGDCPQGACRAHVFVLAVTELLAEWPEQHRLRVWVFLRV